MRARSFRPRPVVGITLIIPEGVIMEDHLTGDPVVRTRTERHRQVPAQ